MGKTLTAPLAEIRVNGVPVGFMKNVRASENYRHTPVKGIGRLNAVEAPATDFSGSLSCSFYSIDLNKAGLPGAINRKAPDVESFIDGVLLNENGVDVALMRKISTGTDPVTKLPIVAFEEFATVRRCILERDDWDLSEGQVGGKNQQFMFLDPIIKSE